MAVSNITNLTNQLNQINNNTTQINHEKSKNNLGNGEISKDGFMQLMLVQMRLQNPLEPTDSTQQLQQQAAFTQIEQLQQLNANLSASTGITQASNFVGKTVTYQPGLDPITKQPRPDVTGVVDSALFTSNGVKLMIGGQEVNPSQVIRLQSNAGPNMAGNMLNPLASAAGTALGAAASQLLP